ncbi:hypothetical protein L6452_34616 [Arctium lappa]|uniref:Uncharacterized protein n=1 Tax=Arctium lappa TaxID=4217 RepID=A0ACB8YK89_ARCLA|nr:hypothetical protein L6452_34616 [Arctium lappa]
MSLRENKTAGRSVAGDGRDRRHRERDEVTSATVPPSPQSQTEILQSANLKSFSFHVLRTATRNFRPDSVLGEGSSYFQALSWNLRLKVALGAAKGLAYLHNPEAKVIYRAFKCFNILIDSGQFFPILKVLTNAQLLISLVKNLR